MTVAASSAQTRITADKNKYTPAQDVQVGQEAAAEVRREMPLLNDDRIDGYVARIGRNLVRAIPPEFQHSEFRYTFEVVNQKEINAFALPGGPMFLNRGMMEAAKAEGEIAGVMAHEISHVALRHGTAQATKGQKFQMGAIAGQILGAVVGGVAGSVIAAGLELRARRVLPAVLTRIRAAGGPSGRSDHGACRLRPAEHGGHVPHDRSPGWRHRAPSG